MLGTKMSSFLSHESGPSRILSLLRVGEEVAEGAELAQNGDLDEVATACGGEVE